MTVAVNLIGQRFGRLRVIERAGSQRNKAAWKCICDCGESMVTKGYYLRKGKTKSCGCFQREGIAERRHKHGATRKGAHWPEYGIWFSMLNRCYRPEAGSFKYYGERGITVCDRWRFGELGKTGFECFIEDMGRRPSAELSIDRVNNDGNYEPTNCQWATMSMQRANQRPYKRNQKAASS